MKTNNLFTISRTVFGELVYLCVFSVPIVYLGLAIQGTGARIDLTDGVSIGGPHGPKYLLESGHQLGLLCKTHFLQLLWQHLVRLEEKGVRLKELSQRKKEWLFVLFFFFLTKQSPYLKGKEGLDTVGSIQTVQAVGPNGSTLSPKKHIHMLVGKTKM